MRKVILDIDTGIDDALAIAYLMAQKDVEVIGLTTTFGNVLVETAFENTTNLLHALKRDDVMVYRGAACPMHDTQYEMSKTSKRVHGDNGIGNVILKPSFRPVPEKNAQQFIKEACYQYGKELTIIAVGPLTTLATVWIEEPDALWSIDRIVCMGGALVVPGNCTPYAEANFYADAEAAKIIMESGLPITMVGLDVTLQATVNEQDIASWLTCDNEVARALYDMCYYYYMNEGKPEGKISGVLHDPLAVEIAIHPEIVEQYYNCDLTVDTRDLYIGRSIGNLDRINTGTRNTKVALRYDAKGFVQHFSLTLYELLKSM